MSSEHHSTSDTTAGVRGRLTFWLIVAAGAICWLLANVLHVSDSLLSGARMVVNGLIVVLCARYVRRVGKQARAQRATPARVTPAQARRRFWQLVALYELVMLPCGALLMYLTGVTADVPPVAQAVMGAVIAVLSLLYFVQHRKPDGSINWR